VSTGLFIAVLGSRGMQHILERHIDKRKSEILWAQLRSPE